jgi:hypothetical protein
VRDKEWGTRENNGNKGILACKFDKAREKVFLK